MNGEPSGLVITAIESAGKPDDWVEVMNESDKPLDLVDFVVVDKRDDLDRARPLGGFVLEPGERHVRILSDATVGFRLSNDEELWVYRASDGAFVTVSDHRGAP